MLDLNLPWAVRVRFRGSGECRARSCPKGLFDGVLTHSLIRTECDDPSRFQSPL